MPLKCISGNQELFAFNITSTEAWNELRASNAQDHSLHMQCCGAGVVLKTSKLGTRYFSHARKGPCLTAPESSEHLRAKEIIATAVQRAGWVARVEQSGQTNDQQTWIADVLASRGGKSAIAFEVQWSRQSLDETERRQNIYRSASVRGMWFMRQHDFPISKDIPAFMLTFDEQTGEFHVLLPAPCFHSSFISARDKLKSEYWQQRIELSRFVEGALRGKLRFAPQIGKMLPLEVSGVYTDCWRCKKTTRIIINLCFAASRIHTGASDVDASIYDFDDDEGHGATLLVNTLRADVLAQHGIGAIKPRYSRTEGQKYLSNGCVHCDALQGRFFEHEFAYEAELIFSVDVLFDDQWTQHLEDDSAFNRWWFEDMPEPSALVSSQMAD